MKAAPAVWFIDNMSIVHVICNGASRYRDLGALAHVLHARMSVLHVSPWIEHVESWSNCADGGTRKGATCPIAKGLQIPLQLVPPITLPDSFPWITPAEAGSIWLSGDH